MIINSLHPNKNYMSNVLTPSFDSQSFRQALSQFATGITVITTKHPDGYFIGLTASSFNSVSLEPPLVLWSLGNTSSNMAAFKHCSHYIVNVLSAEQLSLAKQFSSKSMDRFAGVDFTLSPQGIPVLKGVSSWFICKNRSQYSEGDHVIFVGEVEQCHASPQPALIYHGSQFLKSSDNFTPHA